MEKSIFLGLMIGAIAFAMIAATVIPTVDASSKCNPQGRTTGDPHDDKGAPDSGDPHEKGEEGNPHDRCKK